MKTREDIVSWFRANKLDQYGAVIRRTDILSFADIEVPAVGTMKEFEQIALLEVGITQYLRDLLLKEGKYLKKDGDFYRILLPSQNLQQIQSYMRSADKKLRRARILSVNTPVQHQDIADNLKVRIHMKEQSTRHARAYGHAV
jgi:hypothetical protein